MSEAAKSQSRLVRQMIEQEDLTDEELAAAQSLLDYLSGISDLGSEEMQKIAHHLKKIPKSKRSRHGLGWDF